MAELVLFDFQHDYDNFLPLTFTRHVSDLRIGITRIWEKWLFYNKDVQVYFHSKNYLRRKFPFKVSQYSIFVNSTVLPDERLANAVFNLKNGEGLKSGDNLIAFRSDNFEKVVENNDFSSLNLSEYNGDITKINYPWDIFSLNGKVIESDFKIITKGKKSQPLPSSVNAVNKENIFLEEGVEINFATLNAQDGFIYLGKDAVVMEGALVRGSLALCEHSQLKLGAKIYGPTTIGPHSKVGGEVNNSVIWGYSNKAHDGFLGNAVLGQWCNIGADSNNSNLKNNYAEVKMWNYRQERFIKTGLQFCGLIMADHSKCGINTMFNTGTVVGVNANVFGSGFPRNFIPSFSWGGAQGFTEYKLEKAFDVAGKVMKRRGVELDEVEKEILTSVFEATKKYRSN